MIEMIGDSCSEKEERVDVMVYMVFFNLPFDSFLAWASVLLSSLVRRRSLQCKFAW